MEAPIKINLTVDNRPIIKKLVKGIKNSNNFSATDMQDPKVKKFIAEEICKITGDNNETTI